MNKRITTKERGLLKGAVRRVFSRSELRRAVIDAAEVKHYDPNRPRVKKWCRCAVCKNLVAKYQTQCDHIDPIIPVNTSLEKMTWDDVINRHWCETDNLQAICLQCHKIKSKIENAARRKNKKEIK